MREAPDSLFHSDEPAADAALPQPPAQSLSGHLPVISPQAALASRVLCNAHVAAFMRGLPDIEAWQSAPSACVAGDAPTCSGGDPGLIVLSSMAGTLRIAIDLAAYPALQILAQGAATATTAPLRSAIANALIAPLIENLASAGAGAWRVAAIERAAPLRKNARDGTEERLADIALSWRGRRHRAGVNAPASTLALFEQRVDALARAVAHASEERLWPIPIPGRITLGRRGLTVAALQALEPGDVLLRVMAPATAAALGSGAAFRARAAWGTPGLTRVAATVCIEDSTLTLIEEPFMTGDMEQHDSDRAQFDNDLPDQQNEAEEPDQTYGADERAEPQGDEHTAHPIPIGELELPLQFEIDTVALPLAQVSALRPGYVIELQAPVADARIRLVVHGQTIGQGELVAVGEHLGIRILRMAHGDGSVQ